MKTKQVIQLDQDGYFLGVTYADESPLEAGTFLVPFGCIDAPVPTISEGYRAKWNGEWVYEEIVKPEPKPTPPEIDIPYFEFRRAAYTEEADPLFFKAQRGEATMEEWRAKIDEIKIRFPKE